MARPTASPDPDELRRERRTKKELEEKVAQLSRTIELLQKEMEECKTSECFLRAVIDGIQEPIYAKDRDSRITFANEALARVVGKPVTEIVGRTDSEYFNDPDVGRALREHDLQVMESGQGYSVEEQVPTPDGVRTFTSAKIPYRDASGHIVGIIGISQDITERTETERELLDSEQRYRSVFDNSLYGIMLTQPDGTILAVNKRACEILGMTEEEIVRTGRESVVVADERLRAALAERAKAGKWQGELSLRRADGSIFPAEVSSNVFVTTGGTEMTSMAIQDISQRKEAEEAVRASEQKFKAAFMTGLDGVYMATLEDGRAVEVNDEFVVLTGYSREELIGKTVLELNLYDDPAERERIVSELTTRGWTKDFEMKGRKKNGQMITCSLSASVVRVGGIPHVFGVIKDITERKKADEKLRTNALQLSEAADLARIVYWEQDPHTEELIFNDPFYAFYGTTAEREGGYRMSPQEYGARFVHPDDLARYVQFREENPSGELLLDMEHRIIRRDGQVRHILVRVRRVDDGAGDFRLYGTNQDISARKEAEEILRKSEMSLAAAQQIAHIGSWEWDVVSDSALWSDETFRIFELQPGNLDPHRKTFLETIHPDDRPRVNRALSDALDGTREYDLEYRICLENGKEKVIHALGEAVRGADGRPLLMRGTVRDITDRRRAEEERAKLSSAVEQAGDGIFMLAPDRCLSYVNPATCKIYGFTREELIGSSPTVLRSDVHPPSFHDSVYETLESGKTWSGRQTRRRKDGSLMEAETTMAPVFDASGTLIHYVGVERDITERLRLESQLLQAQKMEAIGTLAGGVAHDFNNILTVIMGLGNVLQMSFGPDDPERPHVDQIVASSRKAADLVQSLLAFSRKQRITLEPHKVYTVVASTAKLLGRLLTEDIALKIDLTDKQAVALLDVAQIDQVLMNLATNARDAMPNGGSLTIGVGRARIGKSFIKTHGFGREDDYVKLSVSDTGTGMDEKTLARIFDPFFTTKEVGKGTGLGLSSVYGIVKQHNGYITVTSEVLKGTTFDIYLPLVDMNEHTTISSAEVKGGTETILVLEDDTDVRRMMVKVLSDRGYVTMEAANGDDAIRVFNNYKDDIDLVILDVVMPGKNGKEVFDEITSVDPGAKAIFMSGYTGDVVIDKGVHEESVDFLQKPLSVEKLLAKVREVLER